MAGYRLNRGFAAFSALWIAACSGPATGVTPAANWQSQHASAHSRKLPVRFAVTIPKRRHHRHGHFVSPSTKSITISVAPGGGGTPILTQTANLTPSSSGCSVNAGSLQCTVSVALPAGSYLASVTTYDQTNAGGNVLSRAQGVPFTVRLGKANSVGLTLNGVPHALAIASGATAVHGTQAAGFTFYGSSVQPLLAFATDADGNVIVGAGAPTFGGAVVQGSSWSVATSSSNPNQLLVTPPGANNSGSVLMVTASFSDDTCAQAGANCTATVSASNDMQTLFAASFTKNEVLAYALPNTTTPTTISNGVDEVQDLALDPYGNLFVANLTGTTEYAPPYTGSPASISTGTDVPQQLRIGSNGNLFVTTRNTNQAYIFKPPYTSAAQQYSLGTNEPTGLLVDSNNDLFVAIRYDNAIREYVPPYLLGPPAALISGGGLGNPLQMAMDAAGDLFVLGYNSNNEVLEYTPPFSSASTPAATIAIPTAAALEYVVVDSNGDLFVSECNVSCFGGLGADAVAEYAPPYTGPPVMITNGINYPMNMAFDGAGNLYVANNSGEDITEYAPPFTGAPIATFSLSDNPGAMVFSP